VYQNTPSTAVKKGGGRNPADDGGLAAGSGLQRRRRSGESPAIGGFSVALARRGEAPDRTDSIRQAMRNQRIGGQPSASGSGCAQASEAAVGRCTRQGGGGVRARGTPWLGLIRSRACGCGMPWRARQERRRCCRASHVLRWPDGLRWAGAGWVEPMGLARSKRIGFLFLF
jgi:hypothetical protein